MLRVFPLASVLLLGALIGCGRPTVAPEDVFNPGKLQGTVDTNLPDHLQAKQQALAAAFEVIMVEFVEPESVAENVPGVQFLETNDEFMEGTIELSRWDFNGEPTGNDVPVVMFFLEDGPEQKQRRVERVYTVTGGAGAATIGRKK